MVWAPNMVMTLLPPLSDQLASWFPGMTCRGLLRLSRMLFASRSSLSAPNSVMSPERMTNFRELSALMSLTTLLRSSAPVLLPTWVSDISANLNDWEAARRQRPERRQHRISDPAVLIMLVIVFILLSGPVSSDHKKRKNRKSAKTSDWVQGTSGIYQPGFCFSAPFV